MKLLRRQFLHLAARASALPAASRIARAQAYPSRPLRCIVGYAPGGGSDIFVRLVGQPLSERLGQPFIIENRAGAASNIATEAVVRAPADGYTLLGTDAAAAINATLYDNLNFNFVSDIAIVGIVQGPLLVTVHPSVPATTVPEFITYAKAHPGKISMASGGSGSASHIGGEFFKMKTGVDMVHVPYRGAAPAMQDLLAGQIHMIFDNIPGALAQSRPGKVRPLGVTSAQRTPVVPDVPAIAETLPGFDINSWTPLTGPAKLPTEVIARLSELSKKALESDDLKARFLDLAATAIWRSPADTLAYRDSEEARLAPIIKASGARVD
jgi:tripartite-type tricarboxylate transporter receptor subunit TctC